MISSVIILAPFILLLLLAAGWDLASYTIPNFIPAALLIAFFLYAILAGYTAGAYEYHLLAALIALVAGFALFALGYIGGGDAKLFASVAIWFGLRDLMPYLIFASLFGGVLTLTLLAARRFPLPQPFASQAWISRLHEPRGGIPYGAALAAGGVATLPYTDLFHGIIA